MGKKKIYAVRNGRKVGVFETWDECKSAVDGYKGAKYKSFQSREEAEVYLKQEEDLPLNSSNKDESDVMKGVHTLTAYVDGSYNDEMKRYSYGLLLILPDGKTIEDYGYGDDKNALPSRNVAGELMGTMKAVKKAVEMGYNEILIFHDYEGIAKWYQGEWKAKSYVATKYMDFMSKHGDIKIDFQWVKGHSGNKNNEIVDKLAKQGLAIGEKPKVGSDYIVVERLKLGDIEVIIDLLSDDFDGLLVKRSEDDVKITWQFIFEKERIVVVYYKDKRKLMMQGRKERVFSVFSAYILELVDSNQIFEVFNPFYNVKVDKEFVENEFVAYLPNKNIEFSPKLNNSIKQAIYNLQLEGDMYDYTFLSFPALRALEGFLRIILQKHKIIVDRSFDCFIPKDKDKGTYKLDEKYHENIGSPKKIRYLNSVYDYHSRHRHTLFHWDYYEKGQKDTTRVLDRNHWRIMITDTLQLMDEYFTVK